MHVEAPLNAYANLVSGTIILAGFIFTFIKIYQGSKSEVAYTLMAFTCGFAIQDLGDFVMALFPKQVMIDGLILYKPNFYFIDILDYFYLVLQL